MALSFPPSPAIGDIFLNWQWNGSAWGPIPGGAGSGGSVSITAGTGVTVSPSPLTGTGTVALSTPVAISAGGTNATTAGAGADNLHGFSGATAGLVRRTGSATYALDSASYLTANQTITLSGDVSGSGTTAITASLATVPIAKGGTGQTTAGAAFNAIAASGGTVGAALSVTGKIFANSADGLNITAPSGNNARVFAGITGGRMYSFGTLTDNSFTVADESLPAYRIIVSSAGSCSASSTWAVISDARLKEDVQPYTRGLAEILPLEPIMFRWTGDGGIPADGDMHYGLTAQQVGEVMPELIREHEYVPPEGAKEGDEPMTLKTYSPTDLTFALIGAVKELHERLTAAEEKITSQSLAMR